MACFTKNHFVKYKIDDKGNIKPFFALNLNEDVIEEVEEEFDKIKIYADRIPKSIDLLRGQGSIREKPQLS